MADITNTMNASASMNAGPGQIISSEPPESVLSPGIREAMDLIFPKTTTQLLQRGFSFEEDKFLGVKASKENLHPGTASASSLHVNALTLPCSISSAYITTTTNTCTCTTAPSEVVTSTHGNGSSTFSLSSFVSSFNPPIYPSAFKSQEETKISGAECKNIKLARKNLGNDRISNSDLEIITSDIAVNDESHGKTSRRGESEDLTLKCDSRVDLDSGDITSPFANIKEKKKQKKKKKKPESDSLICGVNVISGKHLTQLAKSIMDNDTQSLKPDGNSVVLSTDIISNIGTPTEILRHESLRYPYDNANNVNISHFNNGDYTSQNWMFKNGPSNNLHKNSGMASEEVSNNSFSSTKENIQKKGKSKHSLPKVKRRYNILKDKNKIRKAFPPCFVVIKKMDVSLMKPIKNVCDADNSILPLHVRLKHLSDLCEKGSVNCRKRKFVIEEMVYKNIFEETIVVSDDDLENLRGRSLRKRDKHISYVEPSEDDIVDDFSRKRPRVKNIDSASRSEDEILGESKKKKKLNLSNSKTISSDSVTSFTITLPQNSNVKTKVIEKDPKAVVTNKYEVKTIKMSTVGPKEIIVYPPASSLIRNLCSSRVNKKDAFPSTIASTTSDKPKPSIKTYSREKGKNTQDQPCPKSNSISILPQNALPGNFTPQPVMLLPSLPVGFPGSLAAKPFVPGTPISTPISASGEGQKPPQYCVVKMDGADVLLQLVPSSGIGVPAPMVVPKGKTLLMPSVPLVSNSSQLFGQPIQSTLSVTNSTQAMLTSLTSAATTSQGNISSAQLQPLFGIPVISTSSQNVSLPALSIISTISASQLASITSTANIRPINLTSSGAYMSQNSPTSLPGHITVMSSLNSRITSAITSATSSSLSSQVSPAIVTSMAAPITTTVVRSVRVPGQNLRVISPNQSAALRSVRIFVPGCSAIGTPGHFATIGSLTNSSPLTHLTSSSALLPQRKPSSEPELSAEQRAARRRKLEKKYPLPPGVVIKTEPLDVTKPSSVVTAVSGSRSLLSQNLHLLSTSRPGGLQSIRIISPSLASALSVRNIRGNSNIIYRAASLGGRQTVLLPTSFRQISGKTATAVPSAFIATSISSSCISSSPIPLEVATVTAGAATAVTTTKTTSTISTSFNPTDLLSSTKTSSEGNFSLESHSPVPQLALSENTLTNKPAPTSDSTTELPTEGISLQTSEIISCESSLITNTTASSLTASLNYTCDSLSASAVLTNSSDNQELSPSSDADTLESFRTSLEKLRKMILVQEAHGLKGERLQKLKELLQKKEEHYTELQSLRSMSTSPFVAPEDNCSMPGAIIYSDGSKNVAVTVDGHSFSEAEPIVID